MSLESRLQKLEQALASRLPPTVVRIDFIVVETHEEALALQALEKDQPPPRYKGRVQLVPGETHLARDYLRQQGIILPESAPK